MLEVIIIIIVYLIKVIKIEKDVNYKVPRFFFLNLNWKGCKFKFESSTFETRKRRLYESMTIL